MQYEKELHPTQKSTEILFRDESKAIAYIEDLMTKPEHSTNHTMLFEQPEGFRVYTRVNQPCYGEMRPYGNHIDYPDSPQVKISKPGDLHDPFPYGTPVYIGVRLSQAIQDCPFDLSEIFSDISPWRSLLPQMEVRRNQNNKINAVVMTDTDFKPTPFIGLLMFLRNCSWGWNPIARDPVEWHIQNIPGYPIFFYLFMSRFCSFPYHFDTGKPKPTDKIDFVPTHSGYDLSGSLSLSAFLNGHAYDLDEGRTFKQRQPYNRPQLSAVFGYKHFSEEFKEHRTSLDAKELEEVYAIAYSHKNDPIPETVCGNGNLPPKIS